MGEFLFYEGLMCYSPEASFIAGTLLAASAVATVSKAKRYDRSLMVLSFFPVIFSLHQFIEGWVWLTLEDDVIGQWFRYAYIIIAFLIWPTLAPLAVYIAETDVKRKKWCAGLLVLGAGVTLFMSYKLAFDSIGIEVTIVKDSLNYQVLPVEAAPPMLVNYLYSVATLVPFLISSNRMINLFGAAIAVAFAVTFYFLFQVYFSTWCMASALLSMMIYLCIKPKSQAFSHP